jgi:hypothetical protein
MNLIPDVGEQDVQQVRAERLLVIAISTAHQVMYLAYSFFPSA